MGVGAVAGWDCDYDYDQDGVYIGFKGKGKDKGSKRRKGKRECYNCGSAGHIWRECHHPYTGKSKGLPLKCHIWRKCDIQPAMPQEQRR